jgi:hypothetical protein
MVQRSGRCLDTRKATPLMVKLSDAKTKNLTMEFMLRFSQEKDHFKGVTIPHLITVTEKEMCRQSSSRGKAETRRR